MHKAIFSALLIISPVSCDTRTEYMLHEYSVIYTCTLAEVCWKHFTKLIIYESTADRHFIFLMCITLFCGFLQSSFNLFSFTKSYTEYYDESSSSPANAFCIKAEETL